MMNFCPKCGIKLTEKSAFCSNCGYKLELAYHNFEKLNKSDEINTFEKQIAYRSNINQNPNNMINPQAKSRCSEPQRFVKKPKSRKKFLTCGITIIIVSMLILASLFIVINRNENKEESLKVSKLLEEEGPKVSLHSLSAGTVSSIPKEGYSATYGLYDQSGIFGVPNQRIGEIREENLGKTSFNGKECILVKTYGDISIPIKNLIQTYNEVSSYSSSSPYSTDDQANNMINMIPDELPFNIYSDYYVKEEDNTPIYMDYKIDMTEYMQILQQISMSYGYSEEMDIINSDEPVIIGYIINWNRELGKADMQFYMSGISMLNMNGNFSLKFSEEYWDLNPSLEELYVGFEKIVDFTMTLKLDDFNFDFGSDYRYEDETMTITDDLNDYTQTISTTMEINVIDQENVKVPAGIFNDCYIIQINQIQNNDYDYYDTITSTSSSSTSSMKVWLNENGVMPKAEYSLMQGADMGMGSSNQMLIIKLESYNK